MKYLTLFVLITVIASCNQKEATTKSVVKATTNPKTSLENNLSKIDTLEIILDNDSIANDVICIHKITKTTTEDSLKVLKLRIDFYRNNVFEKSFPIALNTEEAGSEWYFNYGLTNEREERNATLFLTISNGYPACGYAHTHFLFFTPKNSLQLIDTYSTMSDSGWFTTKTFSEFKNSTFSSRTENYWPEENPKDDYYDSGVLSFSDSSVYTFEKNLWKKVLIKPKDTVYKSEKKIFNEIQGLNP